MKYKVAIHLLNGSREDFITDNPKRVIRNFRNFFVGTFAILKENKSIYIDKTKIVKIQIKEIKEEEKE